MEPLDLTKQAPRSAWVQLDGLYMMPRTIDKLRAKLPGGASGQYHIKGFSERLLEAIGVTEGQLQEVVARAASDDDVAAWLREHADTSKYGDINERLSNRSYDDVVDKESFNKKYPGAAASKSNRLFDLMDEDDAANFPRSPRAAQEHH